MKPYGDKRRSGYARTTGKPSCRCCNGSYAKVGRSSNRDNAIRGLKKAARRDSEELIKESLNDTISRFEYIDRPIEEYGYDIIENYNLGILYAFMHSLRAMVPELAWADTENNSGHYSGSRWDIEPRGLSAIPHKYKKNVPQTEEDYTELLERIIKERDANRD